MELRVLAVGDVVGEEGVDFLCRRLPGLRRMCGAGFTVVNGENAASNGLLPRQAEDIFSAGADASTLGNHTWDKLQIVPMMEDNPYPFTAMDAILAGEGADVTLVDFHAEATSEKEAMAWYLDGRAQALWGTHTHVPTADCRVLPGGLGYVTDLGMTGPAMGVIGIRPEQAINRFLGGLPQRFQPAAGPQKLESVLFTIDTAKGRCTGAERLDLEE